MRTPTIHLNGTSLRSLLDGYLEAIRSLRAAQEALAATCPNGRDYYPQGEAAIGEAMEEHRIRAAMLAKVAAELEEIAILISGREGEK
jgi:hypothetical protein